MCLDSVSSSVSPLNIEQSTEEPRSVDSQLSCCNQFHSTTSSVCLSADIGLVNSYPSACMFLCLSISMMSTVDRPRSVLLFCRGWMDVRLDVNAMRVAQVSVAVAFLDESRRRNVTLGTMYFRTATNHSRSTCRQSHSYRRQ